MKPVKDDSYHLVHGDTYRCDTDLEKKIEVCSFEKPFHVREMNCLNEYDVFIKEVPVEKKINTKVYFDNGPYKKKLVKFKDIDKIKGIDRKPNLSVDMYSSENANPSSYTELLNYKLPGKTNYPWLPVVHSVFDSLENRKANSRVLPKPIPEEQPKPQVKVKYVPVRLEDAWRFKSWYGQERRSKCWCYKKNKDKSSIQ